LRRGATRSSSGAGAAASRRRDLFDSLAMELSGSENGDDERQHVLFFSERKIDVLSKAMPPELADYAAP
jgi:hypothetical protein